MALLFLTILAVVILVVILTSPSRENYFFSTDPVDTGIERSLWGSLYTLPNRNRGRYRTIHETPWCVDPLKEEGMCNKMWLTARVSPDAAPCWDCGPETPYEWDKI